MLQAFMAAFFRLRTFFIILGLIALSVLVWFGGPLISLGGYAPLDGVSIRVTVIASLFAVTLLIGILRVYLAQRANARMIRNLLDTANLAALADNQASDEIEIIRERFENSLKILREVSLGKNSRRSYLFELPWYIIIGPAGAGKTTILKNSGLNFPLAERLGIDPVSGMGGTRNCDWWFTDEAVMIDTAGRYTTQDVNAEVDRAAWRGFLELLLKHRRRRPINGVILAISLGDIITQNQGERRKHVEAIKQRLQELMRSFGMRLPVYVLFTKCDLIAGFSEYFDNLDEEERAQVWGMTFPTEDNQLLKDFDMRYVELGDRIEAAVPMRMNDERNIARRCRIYCFPKEFASLRAQIGGFLSDTFRPSRFEMQPMLRGVYYTSGTQEGTPIDRLLGVMARNFGLSTGHRLPFSGKGKTFFVRNLLSNVIFEEQGLIGTNRTLERKMATLHSFAYAGMLVALVGAASLWFGAYARSEIQIGQTRIAAQHLQSDLAILPRYAGFDQILPVLDEARTMSNATTDHSMLGFLQSFGLSAKAGLAPAAASAYDAILIQRLLPVFANRIGVRLDEGISTSTADVGELRNLLRVYLMLGESRYYDRGTVTTAANNEAALAFPLDARRKAAMKGHLDRMIALLPHPVPLDQRLIDSARSHLTRVPPVDQIYAELLRQAYQDPRLREVDLLRVIGATSLEAAPDAHGARSLAIPGIFTHDGFFNFFLPRLPVLVREQLGADWITGGADVDNSVVQSLSQEVARRYIRDYIAAWQSALGRIGVIKFTDLQRATAVLQNLAGPQSPLDQLIDTVRQNVDLAPPGKTTNLADPTQPMGPPTPGPNPSIIQAAQGAAGDVAFKAALGDMPWPGKTISTPFVPLLQMVTPSTTGQMPAINKIHDLLSTLYGTMSNVANAPQPSAAAFNMAQQRAKDPNADALGAIRTDAVLRPEPVRVIMQSLARTSWGLLLDLAHQEIDAAWTRDIVPVCQSAIYNRYPVYSDSKQDMQLADFSQFFRPSGTMDDFFGKNLAPFVIDRGGTYVPATIDGTSLPLLPSSLGAFYRAKQVRDAFFSSRDPAPGVKFSLRPLFLSQALFRATMNFDGQDMTYRHGPVRSYDLRWPNQNDASTVSVTFETVDGKESKVEQSGPWALFRFIDPSVRGNFDRFVLTVNGPQDTHVSYELRAASVNNPFGLSALRSFRCPDRL